MRASGRKRLLVLGAGPIGLEAALYALRLGYDARVVEAGRIGESLRQWGHVTMFSPWSMNRSLLGEGLVHRGPAAPDPDALPTGLDLVERYLVPLARSAPLRGRVQTGTRVLAVARDGAMKGDLIGDPERGARPFRILVERQGRESVLHSDLLIDATGTLGRHRPLGDGGIPAPGERRAAARIERRVPRLPGAAERHYAGKEILLVGAGHSAATSAVHLAALARRRPRTRVHWSWRRPGAVPYARHTDDPLPARDRLARDANAIARGELPGVRPLPGTVIERIAPLRGGRLLVTLRGASGERRVWVDRVVANVGSEPDRSLYAELQIHECYATAAPYKLAAALLGAGSDCLAQPASAAELLCNPEPGFFILGSKSYGRNPAFLLRTGHDQIRTLFAHLAGNPALDLYGVAAGSQERRPRPARPGLRSRAAAGGPPAAAP